jgi:hypothetical protein
VNNSSIRAAVIHNIDEFRENAPVMYAGESPIAYTSAASGARVGNPRIIVMACSGTLLYRPNLS